MAQPAPRVGVGVLVLRGGPQEGSTPTPAVLIGERAGSIGDGQWALPGGHLENGETFEACAAREVLEETGIALVDVRFVTAENVLFASGQHYVTIFMRGSAPEGAEPQLLEPDKCRCWRWVAWPELQAQARAVPLFQPLQQLVDRGFVPS